MKIEISKGYFPKVGQTKKFFVDGLGHLELTGRENEHDEEKRWTVEGYFNDFSFFDENDLDYPRVNVKIVGTIWLSYLRSFNRYERKYISEMTDVFVNGERVMVETERKEFVHGRYEPIMKSLEILNWGGEDTQKRCLEEIINKTWKEINYLFQEHKPSFQEKGDENEEFEPVVETKRSKIPFIGGIAAIIGSAFFIKSRLK